MVEPAIQILQEKKLVGQRRAMSLSDNATFLLWREFMPRRKEIVTSVSSDLISMQVYPVAFDFSFNNLNAQFEKWAAIEVPDFNLVPAGMETFILTNGMYAVFVYKGLSTDPSIFNYIFGEWLPQSKYVLDNRPHFEVLGEKYKNNDPTSEEEIWIPIRLK